MSAVSESDVQRLFASVLGHLRSQKGMTEARTIVLKAGLTVLDEGGHWNPFLRNVQKSFLNLEPRAQEQALRVIAAAVVNEDVRNALAQLGYDYVAGEFVPVEMYDRREAAFIPPSSASELEKATKRLVEGDYTGAITSACGAVDTLMQEVYRKLGLPEQTSFSAKVNTAVDRLAIFDNLRDELKSVGIEETHAGDICKEWRMAMSRAADVLQLLRKRLGDVHGSKPAPRRAAYDAIKWASAICGLFDGR